MKKKIKNNDGVKKVRVITRANNVESNECCCCKNEDIESKTELNLAYDEIHPSDIVNVLQYAENGVFGYMSPKVRDNGFVSNNGFIEPFEDSWAGAFIPGIAFSDDNLDAGQFAGCMMVNTLNDGFRFVSVNDRMDTVDLGPVNVPVIVGNVRHPSGIYIPFNNKESIETGVNYTLGFLDICHNPEKYGINTEPTSIQDAESYKGSDKKNNW